MIIKPGTSIAGCRREILVAAATIINPIFVSHGVDCVVTSGTEIVKHSVKRSAHYRGDALDFRSRDLNNINKAQVLGELIKDLGTDFVVLLEKTHFHIHWAPVFRK